MNSKKIIIVIVVVLLAIAAGAYYVFTKSNEGASESNNNSQQPAQKSGQNNASNDVDSAIETVKKWSNAYFAGDSGTACKLVTDNYVKNVSEKDGTPADCIGQVDRGSALAKSYGVKAGEFTYSESVKDGKVVVSAKWSGSERANNYEMVQENGVWKINAEIEFASEKVE
ncbi:hypothetical protein H7142_00905 [Candidatus Saccharibacteria bacterium]|nr:hypothetical protein [Candidatus Saccharibacteria bacterium]